jgi:hypothetical protein
MFREAQMNNSGLTVAKEIFMRYGGSYFLIGVICPLPR